MHLELYFNDLNGRSEVYKADVLQTPFPSIFTVFSNINKEANRSAQIQPQINLIQSEQAAGLGVCV